MKVIRNYIEYSGLSDDIPTEINGFNDFIIESEKKLEKNKIRIKSFTRCNVQASINRQRLVNIYEEKGIGNKYKLNVEGEIKIRVEYIGICEENIIVSDKKEIPFNINVKILGQYNHSIKIIPNIFIEDIYIKKKSDDVYMISLAGLIIVEC
ncbi:MAG: hypothetical protein ACRCWG_12040 [Sarcina sp.]